MTNCTSLSGVRDKRAALADDRVDLVVHPLTLANSFEDPVRDATGRPG
jgi:hypothetical protein